MAIQSDGKIVAVGRAGGTGFRFALARYNPDGSLDMSFSGGGFETTDFGAGDDEATAVALQGNGKIVVVGVAGGGDFALARYNPNGSLDTSFSGDGKQTTDFGADDEANGVALQGDGKIVAVGGGGAGGDFALARYNPNGSLDTSFSGDGRQTTDFGGDDDQAAGVALQSGKIVAVGFVGCTCPRRPDFVLARYNPNGSLDTSFSGDGKQTTNFGVASTWPRVWRSRATARSSRSARPALPVFALTRYNPDGTLDTSFSGDGRQRTDFGGFGASDGVALQGDGKIVVVGGGAPGPLQLRRLARHELLRRRQADDQLRLAANGVALQGDGKIVVVGSALRRRRATSPSPATTPMGRSTRASPGTASRPPTSGAATLRTGWRSEATAGSSRWARAPQMRRSRLRARPLQPERVTRHELLGRRQADDRLRELQRGGGVAIQGDGKIVAVGDAGGGITGFDFGLARYNANGSLDTSFSGDGKQTTDFGRSSGARGVAIQGDGKIVAVGATSSDPYDFALARYNANGSLDTSFSGDGKQTTGFGSSSAATAVALQADGKIVAVGSGQGFTQSVDFAIARYLGG